MKKVFILIIVVLGAFAASAQKDGKKRVDSLLSILKTAKADTAKVNTYISLGTEFAFDRPDTALYFANEARSLAIKLNYKMGIANALLISGRVFRNQFKFDMALNNFNNALTLYKELLPISVGPENKKAIKKVLERIANADQNIGRNYILQDNYTEALKNYFNASKIYDVLGNKKENAFVILAIGNIYSDMGNFSDALKNFLASLKIAEEIKDKSTIANSYNDIGLVYYYQSNYPEALKNYLTSLKLEEEIPDKRMIANLYGNIGLLYEAQDNPDDALRNYSAALKLDEELKNKMAEGITFQNMGDVYCSKGDFSEAVKNNLESLTIAREIGDSVGVAYAYLGIGKINNRTGNYSAALGNYLNSLKITKEIGVKNLMAVILIYIGENYLKLNKPSQASDYLNKGLSLGKEIGKLDCVRDGFHGLAMVDSIQNNFIEAFRNYKMYIIYRDSIISNETAKKNMQLQMQYDLDKKEAAIKAGQDKKDALALLEMKHQKMRQREYYILGAGLLLLIVIGMISYYRFKRRRDKEQLTTLFKKQLAQAETKALRAQMNPHFIFNCLNSINSLVLDQQHDIASEYLIKFSKLIRLILDNSRSEMISIEKELETLKLYVFLESARFDNKFACVYNIADNINTNSVMIPPMLLQPFVENAIWHGLMQKETEGTITVGIKKEKEDLLNISITDDGIGREKAAQLKSKSATHKSHGLKVTSQRIEMMNKLNFTGAQVHIVDLKDELGQATGTRVELILPF